MHDGEAQPPLTANSFREPIAVKYAVDPSERQTIIPGCEIEARRSERFVAGSLARLMCPLRSTTVTEFPAAGFTTVTRSSTTCPFTRGSNRTISSASVFGTQISPVPGGTDTPNRLVPTCPTKVTETVH